MIWFWWLRVGRSWGKSCWDEVQNGSRWGSGDDVAETEVVEWGLGLGTVGSLALVSAGGGVACMAAWALRP